MTAAPYLSLLSSVGISRHYQDVIQVMHCAPEVDRRTLLVRASIAAKLEQGGSASAEPLVSVIREARISSGISVSTPPLPDAAASLDFSSLGCDGRARPKEICDWNFLEGELRALGFSLQEFGPSAPARGLINTANVIPLAEVTSERTGAILAGGKGSTASDAQRGAIGEFAERYLATAGTSVNVFATSANELRQLGYAVPQFFVGRRDSYSPDLIIDWVTGYTLDGTPSALPAERVYYDYVPKSGIRAFAWQHTAGLAAGSSTEEAIWAGLCECLERDAYWLVMRCRLARPNLDVDQFLEKRPDLKLGLRHAGLEVVLKECSLDWPIRIVHAATIDKTGRVPAFAHGMGSGLTLDHAAEKAVAESLQIRAGLSKLAAANLAKASLPSVPREAVWIWSDPASAELLQHVLSTGGEDTEVPSQTMGSVADAITLFQERGHKATYAGIGQMGDLKAVRVYVADSLLPEPTCEDLPPRMVRWLDKVGLRAPYSDPILT